jgi:hypothetical protein
MKRKQKLTFRPVIKRNMTLHGTQAWDAALQASDRIAVIETPNTITFRFRKRVKEKPRR